MKETEESRTIREPEKEETTDGNDCTQEELNIDPLVLQFLDAGSYERRLEILSMLHCRIDHNMINTMAVAVDVEINDGELERLHKEVGFDIWEPYDETHTVVRFATSFATRPEEIEALRKVLDNIREPLMI